MPTVLHESGYLRRCTREVAPKRLKHFWAIVLTAGTDHISGAADREPRFSPPPESLNIAVSYSYSFLRLTNALLLAFYFSFSPNSPSFFWRPSAIAIYRRRTLRVQVVVRWCVTTPTTQKMNFCKKVYKVANFALVSIFLLFSIKYGYKVGFSTIFAPGGPPRPKKWFLAKRCIK